MAGTDADAARYAERYARHLRLAEIGPRGQERFCASAVRVTGSGAAAEEAALYLCAAGVGRLILDPPLAARLRVRMAELNPDVRIVPAALDAHVVTPKTPERRADGVQAALTILLALAGAGETTP